MTTVKILIAAAALLIGAASTSGAPAQTCDDEERTNTEIAEGIGIRLRLQYQSDVMNHPENVRELAQQTIEKAKEMARYVESLQSPQCKGTGKK